MLEKVFAHPVCRYGKERIYFVAGAAGVAGAGDGAAGGAAGRGFAGIDCFVTGADEPDIKEEDCRLAMYVKAKEVSMKIMATAAVIFPRKVPAPLDPKTV